MEETMFDSSAQDASRKGVQTKWETFEDELITDPEYVTDSEMKKSEEEAHQKFLVDLKFVDPLIHFDQYQKTPRSFNKIVEFPTLAKLCAIVVIETGQMNDLWECLPGLDLKRHLLNYLERVIVRAVSRGVKCIEVYRDFGGGQTALRMAFTGGAALAFAGDTMPITNDAQPVVDNTLLVMCGSQSPYTVRIENTHKGVTYVAEKIWANTYLLIQIEVKYDLLGEMYEVVSMYLFNAARFEVLFLCCVTPESWEAFPEIALVGMGRGYRLVDVEEFSLDDGEDSEVVVLDRQWEMRNLLATMKAHEKERKAMKEREAAEEERLHNKQWWALTMAPNRDG